MGSLVTSDMSRGLPEPERVGHASFIESIGVFAHLPGASEATGLGSRGASVLCRSHTSTSSLLKDVTMPRSTPGSKHSPSTPLGGLLCFSSAHSGHLASPRLLPVHVHGVWFFKKTNHS
jgi:hypothetical protein